MKFPRADITTSQNLSVSALDYTTSISRKFKLENIHFHASIPITETITIILDSAQGANYDVILREVTLYSEQNYIFIPEQEVNFQKGDEIRIQCTNANLIGTIYSIIKTSELP